MNTTAICQGSDFYTLVNVVGIALIGYGLGWIMGVCWTRRGRK